MNKLLIISGPTATGKTALAVKLAKIYNGELVSGDSCQIYRGMDIGTGKDQPKETPIHLIDIINPNQKLSAAEFRDIGIETIKEIQSRDKLPILVGCSGFYIDSIINNNYNTFHIKPNRFLRLILSKFSVNFLQKIYKFLDKKAYQNLNHSDINNHYRLVRKIEIKLSKRRPSFQKTEKFNYIHISLTAPLSHIYKSIDKRVDSRLKEGFLDELKKLLKNYSWSDPGLQVAAYKCMEPYFKNQNQKTLMECLEKWRYAEHSDARRQTCWFKTKSQATFFDITEPRVYQNILETIAKWYNTL